MHVSLAPECSTLVAFCLSVAVVCGGVAAPAPLTVARQVYTREPPAEIATHLDKLRKRDDRAKATLALAARDDAAPYLRMEMKTATDKFYLQDLNEALRAVEKRAYERNKARYAGWAAARRFDLCTELLVDCPGNGDAVELADLALVELHKVREEASEKLGTDRKSRIGFATRFAQKTSGPNHLAEDTVTNPRFDVDFVLLRANVWELAQRGAAMNNSFAAVRAEVRYSPGGPCEWAQSTVLVNNAASAPELLLTMMICDGDVVLDGRLGSRNSCVIIANGDIRSVNGGGANQSYLCAAGDINMPTDGRGNCYHAGGTVTFKTGPKPVERTKEKQTSLSFGVQFLDPREFGLEVAVQNGGVQVMKIAADSPFARHGVEDGDVILSIDDMMADSVATFRRQLRRGVVRESVVLGIRRGGLRTSRIVFLDGVPLPTAAPPREKK